MNQLSVILTTRFAPPVEEVTDLLKAKLYGTQNTGELMSDLHRKMGENTQVLLTFLRPHILAKGHSTLTKAA